MRTWYYHQWAKDFEADWECVDVYGIREVANAPLLAIVLEVSSEDMDCWKNSGDDFLVRFDKVIKVGQVLGANIKWSFVCVREPWFPKQACTTGYWLLPYPELYDMWNGRGE